MRGGMGTIGCTSDSNHSNLSPRRLRTQAHIRNTLLDLLKTTDIEQISMKTLAEAAQINRSTIYQYYDSILSVLGDCISHKAGNANHRIPNPSDSDLLRQVRQVILDSCQGIQENIELYQLVQRCGSKFGPARHAAILQENALEFYKGVTSGLIVQDESLSQHENLLPGLLSATSGLIAQQWVDSGCSENPEEIADITITVFEGIVSSLKHS